MLWIGVWLKIIWEGAIEWFGSEQTVFVFGAIFDAHRALVTGQV